MTPPPDPGQPYDDLPPWDDDLSSIGEEPDFGFDPHVHNTHWWPRLLDRIDDWWVHRQPTAPALRDMLTIPPRRATAAILAVAATVLTLAVALVWSVISGIVGVLRGIGTAISDSAHAATHTGVHDLTSWSLTRTITEPVHTYLTTHSVGLPVTADLLWTFWLATTGGLFVLAVLGSRGARIGWAITGATTTTMVYTATPTAGRAVAAGLTLTVWAVLSVAALSRLGTDQRPVQITIPTLRLPHRDPVD